ncbi:MAG TPA: hypothetical protein VF557_14460 [Jatrophihabitans sp.]|jgi:hypothetical protein|uniref:hypothetical protein n=1 Tax=Jatrophihabitans sp. TaxID=1932789 RepID=UPI002F0B434D
MLMQWDAIGISDEPDAADEYDCMIGPLLQQLFAGASTAALAAWIAEERTEHFALEEDDEADIALATDLTRWWAARIATD